MNAPQTTSYWFFQYQVNDEQGRDLEEVKNGRRIAWRRWPFARRNFSPLDSQGRST